MPVEVRPVADADREWVASLVASTNGSARVVSRGRLHDPTSLPGFVAFDGGRRVGAVTYRLDGAECEVVTLNSEVEGRGSGTALLEAVAAAARAAGAVRLWLVTTNDNTHALRFYQRRGWRIAAVRVGAICASRRLKPEIPEVGNDGIPIRDEIELELAL